MVNYSNFIIPSIDLLDGNIIRLYKGDYNQKTIYNIDIDELLEKYKNFQNLHIVDLNGAKGNDLVNIELIKQICSKFKGKIQVGGGIRDLEIAKNLLENLGIDRICLGTIASTKIDLTQSIIDKLGKEKVVLALDCIAKHGNFLMKINGWKDESEIKLFEIMKKYENIAKYILSTDISVDGTMNGPNFELYKQIKEKFPNFVLQASGGVRNKEDLEKLQKITDFAIVGKALYGSLLKKL